MFDPRTVANAYARTLMGVVTAHGVRAEDVLAGTRVDTVQLESPNGRVLAEDLHRIWAQSLKATGDPLLGLKVAQATRPTTFRGLGLAAESAASLQAGLTLMLRYYRLVSDSSVLAAESHANGDVTLTYTAQLKRLKQFPQQVEAILGGIIVIARWLSERAVVPQSVTFLHRRLGDLAAYRRCFGCDPAFGAPAHTLRFSAADLERKLPQADAELCAVHCALLDRQLETLSQTGIVSAFARQWLTAQVRGAVRIDDLATALGMSVRAVQRQLLKEGHPWTGLVDEARKQALTELLEQGLTLQDAALQLGYHDASSLSRAARRWFGTTAGQWRQKTAD